MSATTVCRLCGGNAGQLSPAGSHYLCEARAKNGWPTPSLGKRCASCNGNGYTVRGSLALFFEEGPGRIAQAINAIAPKCEACGGRGHTGGVD